MHSRQWPRLTLGVVLMSGAVWAAHAQPAGATDPLALRAVNAASKARVDQVRSTKAPGQTVVSSSDTSPRRPSAVPVAPEVTRRGADVHCDLRSAVALQIALEKTGFSPGIIDGLPGPKTERAIREFQRARGLPPTGVVDSATRAALGVQEDSAFIRYTVTAADQAAVGPVPAGWVEKSRLARLAYPSLAEVIAEKFHCSQPLLARMNPGRSLGGLRPSDTLLVPNAQEVEPAGRAARLEVDLGHKLIKAFSEDGRVIGLFHCSVAARREKLPSGRAEVVDIAVNPSYTFDPEMWPEVKGIREKLTIPPGPRNPVGVRWIALSLPGVGIHGTPNPELIGKTGSHGCIRLTNWDAVRLAKMVGPGTPVRFTGGPGERLADAQ